MSNSEQTFDKIVSKLHKLADRNKVNLKKNKFGIVSTNPLGIYHQDLRLIAKDTGFNNELAMQLFDTDIYEARILCSKIFNPKDITEDLMEKWVYTFENWEVCDSFCMAIFAKSDFAVAKALEWSNREREFEKRAGFVIMAAYSMADKHAENIIFEQFFPVISREVNDERLYVKKAVNWALRNIGKRNIDLNKKAINVAKNIVQSENKSAKWIAKNALKELEKPGVSMRNYPKKIYR